MTKEKKREYDRRYRVANKEREAAGRKAWCEANKEKIAARKQVWIDAKKHEPVVYYLPEHHYVGITNCLYSRLIRHRSFYNRVTEDYEIIYTAKDMTKAKAVERYMHYEMGYNGKHGGTKGY